MERLFVDGAPGEAPSPFLWGSLCQGTQPKFLGIHCFKLHTGEIESDGDVCNGFQMSGCSCFPGRDRRRPGVGSCSLLLSCTRVSGALTFLGSGCMAELFHCASRRMDG